MAVGIKMVLSNGIAGMTFGGCQLFFSILFYLSRLRVDDKLIRS
jgi:hypothetical protein